MDCYAGSFFTKICCQLFSLPLVVTPYRCHWVSSAGTITSVSYINSPWHCPRCSSCCPVHECLTITTSCYSKKDTSIPQGYSGLWSSLLPLFQPSHNKTYSDADWAGCPDSRHSTTGISVFLGSNLISWTAKKQPIVSCSGVEAEYKALGHVCAETTWVSHLLQELPLLTTAPITLLCDNLSTTYTASNPVFHAWTKHIKLDYHFIQERILSQSHRVHQIADIFKKGLHKLRFQLLQSDLVSPRQLSLRGGC